MKFLFLLALLSMAAPVHNDDFPTLSDQILYGAVKRKSAAIIPMTVLGWGGYRRAVASFVWG